MSLVVFLWLCYPLLPLMDSPSPPLCLSPFPSLSSCPCSAGYYSTTVSPDLKVIAVETNFCYKENWWLLMNSTDPAHELNWLITELLESEKSGQKVHIIGHIPPATADCLPSWSYNYFMIANR